MTKLIKFLTDNKAHLKFSTIDDAIGCTTGTVARVVRGSEYRHFTEEQETAIIEYLEKIGKNIKKYMAENLAISK